MDSIDLTASPAPMQSTRKPENLKYIISAGSAGPGFGHHIHVGIIGSMTVHVA